MYNSSYEEYMQNVLGYNVRPQNTYQMPEDIYEMPRNSYENINLEGLYPDIYKMVYPMVQKVCMNVNGLVNEEMICSMTDEVYKAMVEEETRDSNDTKKNNNSQNIRRIEETRQNNYLLRDLIRILIINELLRRRPGRPPRPPMGPGYPPVHGGPNFPRL